VNSPTNMHTNENVYWWAYFSYEKLQVHQSTQGGDAFTFFGLWSRWSDTLNAVAYSLSADGRTGPGQGDSLASRRAFLSNVPYSGVGLRCR